MSKVPSLVSRYGDPSPGGAPQHDETPIEELKRRLSMWGESAANGARNDEEEESCIIFLGTYLDGG